MCFLRMNVAWRYICLPLVLLLAGVLHAPAVEESRLPKAVELCPYWEDGRLSQVTQEEMLQELAGRRPCWQLSRRIWWLRGGGVMSFKTMPLSDVLVEWEEYEIPPKERRSAEEVTGLRPVRLTGVLYKEFAADKKAGASEPSPDLQLGRMAMEETSRIFPRLKSYFFDLERRAPRHFDDKTLWSMKRGAVILKGWGEEGAMSFKKFRSRECYFITLSLMPENKRKPVAEKQEPGTYSRELLDERLKECTCRNGSTGENMGGVDVALTLTFVETLLGRAVGGAMEMERKVRTRDCPAGAKGLRALAKLSPQAHFLRLYKTGEPVGANSLKIGGQKLAVPPILAEVHKHMGEAPLLWLVADAPGEGDKLRGRLRLVVDYDLEAQTISWVEFCERGLRRGTTPAAEAQRASECNDAAPQG